MQIIIDTEIIKDLIEHEWGYEGIRDDLDEIFEKHGTPLPKGHGRLIDASQLLTVTECREDGTEYCYVPYTHIEDALTIVEADKRI